MIFKFVNVLFIFVLKEFVVDLDLVVNYSFCMKIIDV